MLTYICATNANVMVLWVIFDHCQVYNDSRFVVLVVVVIPIDGSGRIIGPQFILILIESATTTTIVLCYTPQVVSAFERINGKKYAVGSIW